MELAFGLVVYTLGIAVLTWLASQRLPAIVSDWMESDVTASVIISILVSVIAMGLLMIGFGADLYFHSKLADFAVVAAVAILSGFVSVRFAKPGSDSDSGAAHS